MADIIDELLPRSVGRGAGRLLTNHTKLLEFFVKKRGRRVTTWATICHITCVWRKGRQVVDDLVEAGYLKKLTNGWRLTDAGEAEIRKIWPNIEGTP